MIEVPVCIRGKVGLWRFIVNTKLRTPQPAELGVDYKTIDRDLASMRDRLAGNSLPALQPKQVSG
jgi:hypothetical protein